MYIQVFKNIIQLTQLSILTDILFTYPYSAHFCSYYFAWNFSPLTIWTKQNFVFCSKPKTKQAAKEEDEEEEEEDDEEEEGEDEEEEEEEEDEEGTKEKKAEDTDMDLTTIEVH